MTIALANIRIVLVEPAGPLNVGSVARVMKNMGLQELVLVNPKCDHLGGAARLMAVRAVDILEVAKTVATLPEALEGCQRAIATTSVNRSLPTEMELPRDALPWLLNSPAALIFGREDTGLTNTELNYAQRLVRIPTDETYAALNLAQAVAVCSYELYQASLGIEESVTPAAGESVSVASLDAMEGYYRQLEELLLKIGYLYPHTASSRMEKFRGLFKRTELSSAEVTMLRGVLSQVEWALECDRDR